MSFIYNVWKARVGASGYKWNNNQETYKLMLLKEGYLKNKDHNYYSEVSNFEIDAAEALNYTTGGITTSGFSVTEDDVNDKAVFHSFNVIWGQLNAAVIYAGILYRDSGTPNSSELICWISGVGLPRVANGANLVFNFSNGVYEVR